MVGVGLGCSSLPLVVVFVWRQSLFISLWLAQAGLELVLRLLPFPSCWHYRCVPPCLVYVVLGMENGTLCTVALYGRSLIGVTVHCPTSYTAASASGSFISQGLRCYGHWLLITWNVLAP